ncbi:MAG: hypothetical protein GTO02_07565, partial [Candidatus Dadabacteria bacterium]|nr:hypothetical protein [Candidatus Dadabacteria bacterium]NIQ14253.1 hypothetical protein [Candidatus Dadabacteria bacterium]
MNKIFTYGTLLFLTITLNSCAAGKFINAYISVNKKGGTLNGQIYTSPYNSYKIGKLDNNWKRINVKKGDIAYYNKESDSTITVNSDCRKEKRRYSLKALSNSLVVGFRNKEIIERKELDIDQSTGLYNEYAGTLNGQEISLATVVYKSQKCNYDFSYS